jgi:hypothetical protein
MAIKLTTLPMISEPFGLHHVIGTIPKVCLAADFGLAEIGERIFRWTLADHALPLHKSPMMSVLPDDVGAKHK